MPNIGYGSDKKTRHYLPNGFKKFVVHNVKDLELLMMHNRWRFEVFHCNLLDCNLKALHQLILCITPLFSVNSGHTVPRLLTMFLPGRGRTLLRELLSLMLWWQTKLPDFAARRMNRSECYGNLFMFCSEIRLTPLIWINFVVFSSKPVATFSMLLVILLSQYFLSLFW